MVEGLPKIVITTGDPAGVGPDLALKVAQLPYRGYIAAIGDRNLLRERSENLGLQIPINDYENTPHRPGELDVIHVPCKDRPEPGKLNVRNSEYVVRTIDKAVDLCQEGPFDAMVTCPVHKAIINEAGIPFSGHTEWIAQRCFVDNPVMMLATESLRVCLLTTHTPLANVPSQVTAPRLREVLNIMFDSLLHLFDIKEPTIGVCGLNPHAGEGGYLGDEEIEIISPVLDEMRAQGASVAGPLPADTAFTPARLATLDAVLAMYHDQGLPVIKHSGFGKVVNITLGLPIVRTSVDHGTALDLAGTHKASESSLNAAILSAHKLAMNMKARASS